MQEDLIVLLGIAKNTFTNQTNQGNGYVETINNDFKSMMEELKWAYEKMLLVKNEQIALLNELLKKKE